MLPVPPVPHILEAGPVEDGEGDDEGVHAAPVGDGADPGKLLLTPGILNTAGMLELHTKVCEYFTITGKAPTMAFSKLKAPISTREIMMGEGNEQPPCHYEWWSWV